MTGAENYGSRELREQELWEHRGVGVDVVKWCASGCCGSGKSGRRCGS